VRVLWVTPQHPDHRGSGGARHELELLEALSAHHDIEVLTTYPGAEPLDGIPLDVVRGWQPGRGPTNKRERLELELGARGPAFTFPMRHRLGPLGDEIARRDADLVHVMLGELGPALASTTHARTLLLFDSYTRHAEAQLRVEERPRRRVLARIELARCRHFERRWYSLADGLACVSPQDAAVVSSLVDREVEVLPNPIPAELFAPSPRRPDPNTVLFVGSMGYAPNIDAVEWLVAEIWPRVVATRPDARLVAVGRAIDDQTVMDRLRALLGDRLVLDIDDIRTAYWSAAVSIAPMRLGGGLKNKVIHAMACGTPVVCTSAAAEGTGAQDREHIVLADDADALAAAVVEVLDDPEPARAMAERARHHVEAFATDRVVLDMERWWDRALERHARGAAAQAP
jgi:glycosyltransferase involved in cell wall biosynthesis